MGIASPLVLVIGALNINGQWPSALLAHGFTIQKTLDASEALNAILEGEHQVVLLHYPLHSTAREMMKLGHTLRRLRPSVGIILLDTHWSATERWHLLQEFADECLTLDAKAEELFTISRALSRRALASVSMSCQLSKGSLQLDMVGSFVVIDGKEIQLQPLQARILACLMQRTGTVVSHDQLSRLVFRTPHINPNSRGCPVSC